MCREVQLTSILLATIASGCSGTLISRSDEMIGAYPMQAVACDFVLMGHVFSGAEMWMKGNHVSGPMCLLMGFISLPLDLVLDVFFLPGDLIAWPFGKYK